MLDYKGTRKQTSKKLRMKANANSFVQLFIFPVLLHFEEREQMGFRNMDTPSNTWREHCFLKELLLNRILWKEFK